MTLCGLLKKRNYLDISRRKSLAETNMQEAIRSIVCCVAPEELAGEAAIEVHAEAEGPMRARSGSNRLGLEYSMYAQALWES